MILSLSQDPEYLKQLLTGEIQLPKVDIYAPGTGRVRRLVGASENIQDECDRMRAGNTVTTEVGSVEEALEHLVISPKEQANIDRLSTHDLVIFEYWAEWCDQCKNQIVALEDYVENQPNSTVALVKVEQDFYKVTGIKIRKKEVAQV